MSGLAQYDPKAIHARASQLWEANGYFHTDATPGAEPFGIVMPPPNVTGVLHLGHALNNTLQDVLIRFHRLNGRAALWMAGADHAGIATQAVVEKRLKEQENKTRHDIGRDALVQRIWDWKDQCEARIVEQLKGMGASCDWRRWRFTLDETCSKAVRKAFFMLFERGLIFRGKRLVNWDVHLQTAVADDELEDKEVDGSMWHFRYPVEGSDRFLEIATTRPETMLGDTAVAVHPEDERYKDLIGKHVRLPLMDRLIPIVADGMLVDPKFGTGVVKVTPAHDPNDYKCGQRHNLPMINVMTPTGKINEHGGKYAGLSRQDARKAVVADLDALGLLAGVKPHKHNVPHSDRSKTPIEPYLSDQWFVKMDPLVDAALAAVNDGKVKFHPPRYAENYLRWLGERRDWCISRQLWWGHRIPVWRLPAANPDRAAVQAIAAKLKPLAEKSPTEACVTLSEGEAGWDIHACLLADDPANIAAFEAAGLVRDPDVLDTWFSSALWPISVFGWPEETPELGHFYPTSLLSTAREIITLWVARMVVMGEFCRGAVPFRDVYIHAVILDGNGERMSKSKGNGVDPFDIIEKYGADALRFTLTHLATETQDVRMPVVKEKQPNGVEINTSTKFELGRNFGTKVFNASKLILANLEGYEPGPTPADELAVEDRWILHRTNETIAAVTQAIESYRFSESARLLYDFVWGEVCDWYLELIKTRLREPGRDKTVAQRVAATVLDSVLRLLHPIMPFVTEEVWQAMKETAPSRGYPTPESGAAACAIAPWPNANAAWQFPDAADRIAGLQQAVTAVRNLRSQFNVNPKEEIEVLVECPADLAEFLSANAAKALHLAKVKSWTCGPTIARPKGSAAQVLARCRVYLPFGDLIDRPAEIAKQTKKLADLDKRLAGTRAKLGNETFVSRAPADVVEQLKQTEAEVLEQIAAVKAVMEDLRD